MISLQRFGEDIISPNNKSQSIDSFLNLISPFENSLNAQIRKGRWTSEEDELLRKYAPMYDEKRWKKISKMISGRTPIQCLHRWTKILKPGSCKRSVDF